MNFSANIRGAEKTGPEEVLGGPKHSGPANTLTIEDAMAASIIRLEQENQELRAEVALLQAQARMITDERDEARAQYQTELKAQREARAIVQSYRDAACRQSCRDKEAADRIGGNRWSQYMTGDRIEILWHIAAEQAERWIPGLLLNRHEDGRCVVKADCGWYCNDAAPECVREVHQ